MQDTYDSINKDFKENVLPSLIPGVSKHILTGYIQGPGKFEPIIGNDFALGTPYDPKSTRFVHFTSLSVLHSIINENAVRMYNMLNLNDPNEYTYFDKLLPEERHPKSDLYILSLCDISALDSRNALNLWRLYGNGGSGVAIELEIKFHGHTSDGGYFLGKVIYEKPNLEEFRKKNSEFEKRNGVETDARKLMKVPACFHKNPYYQIEEEVRLMFYEGGSKITATNFPEHNRFKWDFNSRNELVTYHKFPLGREIESPWITVKRVQLGFKHSEEDCKKIKKHFDSLIWRMKKENIRSGQEELPIIELSPLKDIYR